ncbi:DUF4349 domain-containing protein [Chryseobacterium oryzae]|uniref:DUF4349 domain-containing protein n=1 Tax=Chryseobacterium oryzae TaxID=2929799 RepID=A0ABY4BFV6_9FLAO|nr:DUF4349 domain-containing protein [Chryseobacterium oryzae]UOE38047.1 DUF4349 domain-containing protein [Chryseobacterium oryzae]
MKTKYIKLSLASILLFGIYSCKKGESLSDSSNDNKKITAISDSISSAATMKVKEKQFIKTAAVNMEVKDVYDATIFIEKSAQDLSGFVTHSDLKSNVVSEETYDTSDEQAILIKKYQTENTMQVRVPTERLGELLTLINDKKLFLNSRVINAEDVTSNIKYGKLEGERIKKNEENISKLKNNKGKVQLDNNNTSEGNQQQLENMNIADNLKYSTIDIYLKEPKIRVAEITVTNTKNIEDKYKFNFFYSIKNAFVEGYYLVQKLIVGLITVWPLVIIAAITLYFYRKNKSNKITKNSNFEK